MVFWLDHLSSLTELIIKKTIQISQRDKINKPFSLVKLEGKLFIFQDFWKEITCLVFAQIKKIINFISSLENIFFLRLLESKNKTDVRSLITILLFFPFTKASLPFCSYLRVVNISKQSSLKLFLERFLNHLNFVDKDKNNTICIEKGFINDQQLIR